ncbi:MAG: sulfite exporter TauE/SafE family protein, partial [Blautia sp.]
LLSSLATKSVPDFQLITLVFMVIGGIAGGAFGRKVNKKIEDKTVDKLFIGLMVLIILINIYNIMKFVR